MPEGTAGTLAGGVLAGVVDVPGVTGVLGGSRISVYFVPSAVFWSVTGVFSFSVIACEPSA